MAKTSRDKKAEKLDYSAAVKALRQNGPGRVYLLYGEEDYLRERFFDELVKACIEPDSAEFNHKRLRGAQALLPEITQAVNALPFFAERTLVEVRDFDINKCKDAQAEALRALLEDIPDYCTLVFLLETGYTPDGRLAAFKAIKKAGEVLEFTPQGQGLLFGWVAKRFAAQGKRISRENIEHLVFVSGGLMNRLIPEIDKLSAYASGEEITREDIDTVAHHLPEARVFEMTDALAKRDYNTAFAVLAELMQMRDQHPIMILATIGQQMRNLYAARLAQEQGLGRDFVMEAAKQRYTFLADRLISAARGFSLAQLREAVALCTACDYAMKTSSGDETALLEELMLRIAAGGGHA